MSQYKVLRLFEGANTSEDWHVRSSGYTREEIANIPDPAASSRKEITSIPSPFARVHLFENAFTSVTNQAMREGYPTLTLKTAYHQLVSDALDVAEVFFNFEIFNRTNNNLRFVTWKKIREIEQLKKGSKSQKLMGETLELYLNQDTGSTRFDLVDNFYLLFCNNVLIGGTSPSTLFFGAYNEGFKLAALGLGKGDDKFFDEQPCPLYQRSRPFLRYLFGLFKVYPQLRDTMNPLWRYMDINLQMLARERSEDAHNIIDGIQNNNDYNINAFEQEFKAANSGEENAFIEVVRGIYHRRLQAEALNYSKDPFALKTEKYSKGPIPLALQNNFAKTLSYCGGTWKPDTKVPYFDPQELNKRMLPGTAEAYPYLTVSDFLEPQILQVTYPIDREFFFDGNPEGFRMSDRSVGDGIPGEDSFLLPVSRRFFDFFDPDYLKSHTPDGRPVFKLVKTGADSVEAQLLLPIQSGDFIAFKRIYSPNQNADPLKNEGLIVVCRMDMGFLPLMHVDKQVQQIVVLTDGDVLPTTKHYDYSLEFYTKEGKGVTPTHKRNRQDKHKHKQYVSSKYYVLDTFYDFLQVSNGQHSGIIVPIWQEKHKGNKKVTVAIDFGTTNSFVAVKIGDEQPQPLEFSMKDRFLATLSESWVNTNPKQLKEVILRSLLPFSLGKGQECFLPMRTIISEIEGVNHDQVVSGTDISIPFFFERRLVLHNEEIVPNLKWLKLSDKNGDANNIRVISYLSVLLFLVRNYILAKGGKLDDCTFVWLYPSSMGEQNVNRFQRTWNELAVQYLGEKVKVERHSEAIAPYYAFNLSETKSGDKPVLNIDIGGGTTDVIILQESKPLFSTSFRYAGNTIFGNGFGDANLRINGLLRLFKEDIDRWFDNNSGKIYNINDAYRGDNGIAQMGSADINSFYFFVANNKEVLDSGLKPISYHNLLSDREDVKVVFLFFFSAIVYHVAHLMKRLELPLPRQIAFSGKGAGVVNLLDAHPKQRNAAGLAQLIFQKVYGVEKYYSEGLEILMRDTPKESTCYGAVKLAESNIIINEPPTSILLGNDSLMVGNPNKDGKEVRYRDIDDKMLASVEQDVRDFIDFFFKLNADFSFSSKFGALTGERLQQCKVILSNDLRNNVKVGLAERMSTVDGDDHINEPLFFYPLTGSIFQLLSHFADEATKPASV